jgi:predicted amidohydrolase YtcJ
VSDSGLLTIPRCYDSHVHWSSTGEVLNQIDLTGLRSLAELRRRQDTIKPNRGEWIIGFGWDQSTWPVEDIPDRKILDELFPNHPVAFSRIDGHALWVNSLAMRLANIPVEFSASAVGGRVELDASGKPNGLFLDAAREAIDSVIPSPEPSSLFNRAGFSHIRDVGGSLRDWQWATELENQGRLTLFCEMYFNLENGEVLDQRIKDILESRRQPSTQIRMAGLKLFFDGALGSEGALLSQPYPSGKRGFHLYEAAGLEEIFRRCWEKEIPVAIHTLGDEAVHQVVLVARRLKERGVEGELNLEHCEVVRPETIELMKTLSVRCHLQPSHFLSDQRWLREKLGGLYKDCFPWKRLIEAGVPVSFGSDSPIEQPSLPRTAHAIEAAAGAGIEAPPVALWKFHSHPDGRWGAHCCTQLTDDGHVQMHFQK